MVEPEKASPAAKTTVRTTGPALLDSRQGAPSVAIARPDNFGTDLMAVEGIYGCLRRNREKSPEEAPYSV